MIYATKNQIEQLELVEKYLRSLNIKEADEKAEKLKECIDDIKIKSEQNNKRNNAIVARKRKENPNYGRPSKEQTARYYLEKSQKDRDNLRREVKEWLEFSSSHYIDYDRRKEKEIELMEKARACHMIKEVKELLR